MSFSWLLTAWFAFCFYQAALFLAYLIAGLVHDISHELDWRIYYWIVILLSANVWLQLVN